MFRASAHVYDLIYQAAGKDYAAESANVCDEILNRKPGARSLLDVACGTGGHLRHLRNWFDVVGVDIDPGMLNEARRHLADIELVEADMRSFTLNRSFDAVICLFSSIGYMRSLEDLHTAITVMAGHLTSGGVLIVDGWVRPDAWIDSGTTHMEVAETDSLKVVRMDRSDRDGDKTHLEMHYLIATVDRIDHVVEEHTLRLFTDDQYRAAFAAAGVTVEASPSPMHGRDRYIGLAHRNPGQPS